MAVDSNAESLSAFITFVLVRQISNSNSATPQTCKTLPAIQKMDIQTSFDKLILLIRQTKQDSNFVTELLDICSTAEITYMSFDINGTETTIPTKEHLLRIYEIRGQIEKDRQDNPFVFGYDSLLPALRQTKHGHVCISAITSEKGTYVIFTDFNKTDFIGLLKSKQTLTEIRDKYRQHKELVEQSGQELLYDYEANKNVFINGQFQQ